MWAGLGNSFFLIEFFYSLYRLTHIIPAYPHEDTFMQSISWFILIVAGAVAFIVSFLVIALTKNEHPASN